jgi:SAM-dependent methyltransferase
MAEQLPRFALEFGKDGLPPADADGRLDAPAFHRNHEAIAPTLTSFLQGRAGDVLEIGSGTGQHAVAFGSRMPSISWWPTDLSESHLRSIEAWRKHEKLDNVKPPVRLDASAADWRLDQLGLPSVFTAMFCANVIHIAPWAVAEGLFAGARRHLASGGRLYFYGPFKRDGVHNAASNAAFDESLRARDSSWGVRDVADLKKLAAASNLKFSGLAEMPSNNAILTFERTA